MGHTGWTAAELEAMTPADRQRLFNDGLEIDLRAVRPDQARQALDRIRETLSQS